MVSPRWANTQPQERHCAFCGILFLPFVAVAGCLFVPTMRCTPHRRTVCKIAPNTSHLPAIKKALPSVESPPSPSHPTPTVRACASQTARGRPPIPFQVRCVVEAASRREQIARPRSTALFVRRVGVMLRTRLVDGAVADKGEDYAAEEQHAGAGDDHGAGRVESHFAVPSARGCLNAVVCDGRLSPRLATSPPLFFPEIWPWCRTFGCHLCVRLVSCDHVCGDLPFEGTEREQRARK